MKMIMARFPVLKPLAILSQFNLNESLKILECLYQQGKSSDAK